MIPCAPRSIIIVSADEKIMFWPELRNASEVAILIEALSYVLRVSSYCLISNFSLLNSLTAS